VNLELRVAAAALVAVAAFGVLFLRLWSLQVLDDDRYVALARQNRIRTERVEAPRGAIRDAHGRVLVESRLAGAVAIDPAKLPADYRSAAAAWGRAMAQRRALVARKVRVGKPPSRPSPSGETAQTYRRLARVLRIPAATVNRRVIASLVERPYADARVSAGVTASQRAYIAERRDRFAPVVLRDAYVRRYPYGSAGAALWGRIGRIGSHQLSERRFAGVAPDATVGQSGLELQYDALLRGRDGRTRIQVDARGERRGVVSARRPRIGHDLRLTLDIELQRAGEAALRRAGAGRPGAFVAINPLTGAVYAMGSLPTFDPRELNREFPTTAAYARRFGTAAGSPLYNRAYQAAYPTGSIFKPITALAALDAGVTTPASTFDDRGCLQTGARKSIDRACNAGKAAYGRVDLRSALEVSSDTYFYDLGLKLYGDRSLPLQRWARRLGLARPTGLDLPYEGRGAVPDPAWVRRINRAERRCRRARHVAGCGIGSGDAQWNPGDEVNLTVGQGALQATPLQMAVALATIVNGGRVPRPHLAARAGRGRPHRTVHLDPGARQAVMDGLFRAANGARGTSTVVWKDGWPHARFPVYGKTGTAERFYGPAQVEHDQAWYAAYAYDAAQPRRRPIVVICTIERGGFGAVSAAPVARLILSHWFGVLPRFVRGTSHTR
jgi:penicillin-binding protein 2